MRGVGEPGPYNLAAGGTLTMSDLADALGWYSVPVPKPRWRPRPRWPPGCRWCRTRSAWLHSVRKPVLMKTTRAKQQLKWRPKHTAKATLEEMAAAQRAARYSSRVVLLAHLARVQQRGAVAHGALHQRGDARLRHADLRQAGGQAEAGDSAVTYAASASPMSGSSMPNSSPMSR